MGTENKDESDYADGRQPGDWKTKYEGPCWFYIAAEFILLTTYLLAANLLLLDAVIDGEDTVTKDGFIYCNLLGFYVSEESTRWIALALAGFIGGTVFDMKWLYHSVAAGIWHQDRCLWRIIVPFNSAMVSLFTGFLFASGIIPFLKNESFDEIFTLLGFGFVFGYFSDNILAALQNLAHQVFGTLKDDRAGPEKLDKGLRCVPPFIGGTEYGEASPFYG